MNRLTENQIREKLAELDISYKEYEHPPLPTSQEANKLRIERSGQQIKNLFVCDNYKRRHFLLLVLPSAQVDLKALSKQLKVSRLGLTSTRRLLDYLGVEAGCVSFLSLLHARLSEVEVLVDKKIWEAKEWQAHPADNQKTFVLTQNDIRKLFQHLSISVTAVDFPELEPVNA